MNPKINQLRSGEPSTVGDPDQEPQFRVIVTGADSDGRVALVDTCERRGAGPPLHRHSREDELILVMDGRVLFQIGNDVHEGRAGTCTMMLRGVEHTYSIVSDEAHLLVVLVPAGFEECLVELRQSPDLRHANGAPDASMHTEHLVATFARYSVEVTGPRIVIDGCDGVGPDAQGGGLVSRQCVAEYGRLGCGEAGDGDQPP